MTVTLRVPGDEVTLTVKSVERVESTAKAGTFRYQIDGTRPDGSPERTYVNEGVLLRELKHKGIADTTGLIGGSFRFYRVAAPNNTPAAGYLNIEVLSAADLKPKPESKRVQPPTVVPGEAPPLPGHPPDAPPLVEDDDAELALSEPSAPETPSIAEQKWTAIEAGYQRAWEIAAATQKDGAKRGVSPIPTPDSIQAGAATVLIAADRIGALR